MERKRYPLSADKYVLYEEVGSGVSASVHRALCITLNEIVAIKVMDCERDNCDLVTSFFVFFLIYLYLTVIDPFHTQYSVSSVCAYEVISIYNIAKSAYMHVIHIYICVCVHVCK